MTKKLWLSSLSFLFLFSASAQDKTTYEKHWLVKGSDSLPYRLLLPKNYDAAKKYPLILFLHGSGERGRDNEAQLTHGWKLFLQDSLRERYPAVVVLPQCSPQPDYWSNVQRVYDSTTQKTAFTFLEDGEPMPAMKLLLALLDEIGRNYRLDARRMYVGGLSMGGMGTYELVRRKPKTFAAAFPICGGANTATAKKLKNVSWWIFHGLKDDVVSPSFSRSMADALKAEGADVKLTLYPNANHNSWDSAFAEPELFAWLFSKHK